MTGNSLADRSANLDLECQSSREWMRLNDRQFLGERKRKSRRRGTRVYDRCATKSVRRIRVERGSSEYAETETEVLGRMDVA